MFGNGTSVLLITVSNQCLSFEAKVKTNAILPSCFIGVVNCTLRCWKMVLSVLVNCVKINECLSFEAKVLGCKCNTP